jgi:hypothetical protein
MFNFNEKFSEVMVGALETFKERNKVYKSCFNNHGEVMKALFPNGVTLKTVSDHVRFFFLTMIVGKLCRYAQNFTSGGHEDSIHDLFIYSAMLETFDAGERGKPL